MARVFVVDDEMTMVQAISELLREDKHEVFPFHNAASILEAMENQSPDLVITDLFLQQSTPEGLQIVQKARALHPPAIVMVVTGYASIETAVEAMKMGAYDYLEKPFKPDDFKLCVQRALSYNKAVSENIYLKKQLRDKYQFNQIIGNSTAIQKVYKLMERVADTESTILILGESGTGKELVARALHFNSRRQFAPFIPINCSALPENLLESELFGHRKGSFTGAISDKKGLFEEADGGSIFLDEIGTMPPMLQSRLLRVLQEREVRRVGENKPIHVNVRVLAATNEPLEQRIKEGTFREDLYYRLNVIPVDLPSLKERKEDIPLLVSHFLKKKRNSQTGVPIRVTRQVMQVLDTHDWPGNVRELENVIERGSALCEDHFIRVADLPPSLQKCAAEQHIEDTHDQADEAQLPAAVPSVRPRSASVAAPSFRASEGESGPAAEGTAYDSTVLSGHTIDRVGNLKDFLREQEVAYLNRSLVLTDNDKEKAASLLGISLATLYRKLAEEDSSA